MSKVEPSRILSLTRKLLIRPNRIWSMLRSLAKQDHRIQVFKPWKHSGIIGKVKNWACSLGSGKILVELDHDDELTNYALDSVVNGFKQFPEAFFLGKMADLAVTQILGQQQLVNLGPVS